MEERKLRVVRATAKIELPPVKFLIAADFDGTVAEDHLKNYMQDSRVRNLAALIRIREGYEFATVTGSRYTRTKDWADQTLSRLYPENGGLEYDPTKPESERLTIKINPNQAHFITQLVSPELEGFLMQQYPGIWTREKGKSEGKVTMSTYYVPEGVDPEHFFGTVVGFFEIKRPLWKPRVFLTHSSTLVDVNYGEATKARALPILCTAYNVGGKDIIFIGDGQNDIPAFEATLQMGGKVVITGNAHGSVREWAADKKNSDILEHDLRDTDCVHDIVSSVRRKAA